jgi:hypothetical protein
MATEVETENPYGLPLYAVESPTNSIFHLQTEQEAQYYERQRDMYQKHNRFMNISDLEDLTRLLTLEVMVYRWSTWLTQGFDYMAARVDEAGLKNAIKEYSTEIRLVKATLGIDRLTREKDKGETLGDYVQNLLDRAKEFGYHRNDQYSKAVTLIWELINQVQTYDRCDEQERTELDLTAESILEWVRTVVLPEWNVINESFRRQQAMWIKSL